jgi:histidinol-phosphate aminotransferase
MTDQPLTTLAASTALPLARVHGGPDGQGVPLHDFSSNSNACGPCPAVLHAVQQADASRYPDASYTALRRQLAAFHQVAVARVVLAASASEFIFRITALAAQRGVRAVYLPPHAYGDYAQAAQAHGMDRVLEPRATALCWACEPSSPLGAVHEGLGRLADAAGAIGTATALVLDRAYEPLRLDGALAMTAAQLQKVWQLWTPNKALGLTGVRAAYAIAPLDSELDVQSMDALCPSWPIGAHGVAMLQTWVQADTQAWLARSLDTLRDWKAQQIEMCRSLGWTVLPSTANFFVCHTGLRGMAMAKAMAELRTHGIKLRDCASFGLPEHIRLSVQSPAAQNTLKMTWQRVTRGAT